MTELLLAVNWRLSSGSREIVYSSWICVSLCVCGIIEGWSPVCYILYDFCKEYLLLSRTTSSESVLIKVSLGSTSKMSVWSSRTHRSEKKKTYNNWCYVKWRTIDCSWSIPTEDKRKKLEEGRGTVKFFFSQNFADFGVVRHSFLY